MKIEFKHIPELDGVRGMSIVMVLFFHLQLTGIIRQHYEIFNTLFIHGWISVDLFFVLSGFLITTILLKTKGRPNYFKTFYTRRILRIFPLYYLYIFLFFLVASNTKIATMEEFSIIMNNKLWFIFYVQNILIATTQQVLPFGLNDLWTLSIEEQFYIVWPFLVFIFPKNKLKYAIAFFIVFPLFFRIISTMNQATWIFNYFFSLARIDTLGFGAFAAYFLHMNKDPLLQKKLVRITSGIGIAGIAIIFLIQKQFLYFEKITNMFGFTCLGLIFFSLIVKVASGDISALSSKIIGNPFFRYCGKISYCMYMIHGLVIYLYETVILEKLELIGLSNHSTLSNIVIVILYFSTVILVASASWFFFESKILKLKKYFSYS